MIVNRITNKICQSTVSFLEKSAISTVDQVIHKNMTLTQLEGDVSRRKQLGSVIPSLNQPITLFESGNKRPLAVLLTWVGAKDGHIDKYRRIWIQKGFDVLTVKTTPIQFFIPKYGAVPLIGDLVKVLSGVTDHYTDILLHCFSVGCYEFGELMYTLNDREFMESIKNENTNEEPKERIEKAIKGIVFDSYVSLDGVPNAISRSITSIEFLRKTLKMIVQAYLYLSYFFATKYFIRSTDSGFRQSLTHAPGLLIVSEKDYMGTKAMSEKLLEEWKSNGIDVSLKVFKDSAHVQHFPKYPEEYQESIDNLLEKVDIPSLVK